MWCGWVAFYDYFVQIGVLKDDKFDQYRQYLEVGGTFTVLFEGIAITSNRPLYVKQDIESRLHCETSSAIRWRDDYELYYLDGVNFEQEMWQKIVDKTITLAEIMAIENADERAVAMKYNPQSMLKDAQLINKSKRDNELYLIENSEINTFLDEPEIWLLRMKCPSTGIYHVEGTEPKFAAQVRNADRVQERHCHIPQGKYGELALEG